MSSIIRKAIQLNWKKVDKDDRERIGRQTPVKGFYKECDIYYTEGDYHEYHKANCYYPENHKFDQTLSTIIVIHGGGWMYGDKDLNGRYCEYLASQGYAVFAPSYRLMPEVDLKEMIQDIFQSLSWLEKYGPDRGFDLDNVLVTGDSAGSHLAGLTTCINLSQKLQILYDVKSVNIQVKALTLSHGVNEFHKYIFTDKHEKPMDLVVKEYAKMAFGKNPRKNPLSNYCGLSQVAVGLDLPPIMIISSKADTEYSYQSDMTYEYLKTTKREVEYVYFEEGPHLRHVFHITHYEWKESLDVNNRMLYFFEKVLRR